MPPHWPAGCILVFAHQRSIHSLGSGSTPLRFRSRSCSCNLSLGLGGLVCCYGPVKLHTCSWWSAQLSVLLILRRRVHPSPASRQLLFMSLTALLACSTVFVVSSSKQHLQCTKLHCRHRQLLRCGWRALMALWALMALNSMNVAVRSSVNADYPLQVKSCPSQVVLAPWSTCTHTYGNLFCIRFTCCVSCLHDHLDLIKWVSTLKCLSVRPQSFFDFNVCSMTRSNVKVTSPWKLEICPFLKAISSPIYNGDDKWPCVLKLGHNI